ncbi:hypothetical protein [Pseudomonas frederiksbergensis]|uniref:hypothetical protein n=1 Tax=Pseudomonas frederiksbergensis TaxID=104087 RepID=UPI001621A1EA|nr:hypothetical protein [Pseudomonas frederiksbergensis]
MNPHMPMTPIAQQHRRRVRQLLHVSTFCLGDIETGQTLHHLRHRQKPGGGVAVQHLQRRLRGHQQHRDIAVVMCDVMDVLGRRIRARV